jgi:hypothetical protein
MVEVIAGVTGLTAVCVCLWVARRKLAKSSTDEAALNYIWDRYGKSNTLSLSRNDSAEGWDVEALSRSGVRYRTFVSDHQVATERGRPPPSNG